MTLSGRKALLWLHLWMGLAAAVFLFVEGISGAALALRPEFNQFFFTHTEHVTSAGSDLSLAQLISKLEQAYPGREIARISPGNARENPWSVRLQTGPRDQDPLFLAVDPHTGGVLWNVNQHVSPLQKTIGNVLSFFGRFHGNFLGSNIGRNVIAWTVVMMLLLGLSGVVLWWPRKILGLKGGSGAARQIFDLHNALGFYSSLLVVLFAFTTITMEWPRGTVNLINRLTGAPPSKILGGNGDDAPAANIQKGRKAAAPAAAKAVLGPDQLLKIAQAEVPNGTWAGVFMSAEGNMRFFATFKIPGEKAMATVAVNPAGGQVQFRRIPGTLTPSERFVGLWMRDIHTGEIYGTPSRIVAMLFSLSLATLAVTGPLIWLTRRRRA